MGLCRFEIASRAVPMTCWGWHEGGRIFPLNSASVVRMFEGGIEGGLELLRDACITEDPFTLDEPAGAGGRQARIQLAAPVLPNQEVWAAGVTYESSKFARMEESEEGGDFYAKVYVAERPELFFKSTPNRVVGPNGKVRIRFDSSWNVPEPELAVVVSASGQILGYTIGNDMSSRDIEGTNPLYLPQAKVYRQSCALGPWIVPASSVDPQALAIRMQISREGDVVFEDHTSTAKMKRMAAELVEWVFRENEFPAGMILLTGTGIVPPEGFSLEPDDEVVIAIAGIGALRNRVVQG